MKFRHAFLLSLALTATAYANHEPVAIVSLIGDEMTVDTFRMQTAARLGVNDPTVMPLKSLLPDQTAMLNAQAQLAAVVEGVVVHTLAVPAPQSDFDPNALFGESRFVADRPKLRVSLVDLATGTLVSEERLTVGHAQSAHQRESGSEPWDVLTPAQKVELLRRIIEEGVQRGVPRLPNPQP